MLLFLQSKHEPRVVWFAKDLKCAELYIKLIFKPFLLPTDNIIYD